MRSMRSVITKLLRDGKGATAVEYGLILALVCLAVVGAIREVGSTTGNMWNNVTDKVQKAG